MADAALMGALHSTIAAGEAVAMHDHKSSSAGYFLMCRLCVKSLPGQWQQPASLAPTSMGTEHLVPWDQEYCCRYSGYL
jgi:hypothetical protein